MTKYCLCRINSSVIVTMTTKYCLCRINEDELGRFYTASNNDFSRFVNLIKKTIHWRESYTFLSRNELEMWSSMVFWHGSDAMHRPCLIVRLGLACSTLASRDRPKFSQAVCMFSTAHAVFLLMVLVPKLSELLICFIS